MTQKGIKTVAVKLEMWWEGSTQPNLFGQKVAHFAQWTKKLYKWKNLDKNPRWLPYSLHNNSQFCRFKVMSPINAFAMEVSPDGGRWS
jgi:hypothetical protein